MKSIVFYGASVWSVALKIQGDIVVTSEEVCMESDLCVQDTIDRSGIGRSWLDIF